MAARRLLNKLLALLGAVKCWLRGHDVNWRFEPDPPLCTGDVVCHTCNVIHWCRAN